jgi:hypothetical protein
VYILQIIMELSSKLDPQCGPWFLEVFYTPNTSIPLYVAKVAVFVLPFLDFKCVQDQ